jgi:hypothetical protein
MKRNKENIIGNCAICGEEKILTKEHIPPQKSDNYNTFYVLTHDEGMNRKYDEPITGKYPNRGGIYFFSLCKKCNSNTGSWYGNGYIDFARQGGIFLHNRNLNPNLIHFYRISPLKIIKQIVSMMMSVNHKLELWKYYPELSEFILQKEKRFLNDKYQIWMFYKGEGNPRYAHLTTSYDPTINQNISTFSEIAYSPFGFLMTFDSPPPDSRLVNISFFADYEYKNVCEIGLQLPVLDTYIPIGGFYDTKEDIDKNYLDSQIGS